MTWHAAGSVGTRSFPVPAATERASSDSVTGPRWLRRVAGAIASAVGVSGEGPQRVGQWRGGPSDEAGEGAVGGGELAVADVRVQRCDESGGAGVEAGLLKDRDVLLGGDPADLDRAVEHLG